MAQVMKLNIELTDGKTHEVDALFSDLVKYDVIRSRQNLPKREDGEFLFMGVTAYCALVRTGKVPNTTKVMDFLEQIAGIEPVEAEEENDEAVFPESN